MSQRTALFAQHEAAGAKFVDFAGWDMPIHYGSQLEEHHAVRQGAGMFDVSHMTPVDVRGDGATAWLRHLLANDVAKLKTPGKALYSCMLTEQGTVIDDLICYRMRDAWYRLVVKAGTTAKDVAWMQQQAPAGVSVEPRHELCILAVQGPEAVAKAAPLLGEAGAAAAALKPFNAAAAGDWFVGRTGYTGEDGFEIIGPAPAIQILWDGLLQAGVRPCGLGARDTLRLEAGMNLYGQDMDETVTPLASGLSWTVSFDDAERDFIGRAALQAQRDAGDLPRFVGRPRRVACSHGRADGPRRRRTDQRGLLAHDGAQHRSGADSGRRCRHDGRDHPRQACPGADRESAFCSSGQGPRAGPGRDHLIFIPRLIVHPESI